MARPPLQVDNAGYLRFVWNNFGTPYAVNVFGFSGTSAQPPTQAIANTVAAAISNALTTSALPVQLGNVIELNQIGLRSINVASQRELIGTHTPVAGTDATALLPLQVSFCVTLRTALAGRRFRGRTYIPGFAQVSNTVQGGATAAVRTAAVAFVNGIRTSLLASGYTLGVISRPVWTETPPGSDQWVLTRPGLITDVLATDGVEGRDLRWDTQRRRLDPGV